MRSLLLAAGLLVVVPGCAHVDRERADYHQEKADRQAQKGHFIKAAKEERKAERADEDAARDPLP